MRFYLDEDISPRVAALVRAQGLDVISSQECGRNGLPDDQQLRLAAEAGRCFVTRNRKHFVPLTVRFFEQQWPHAGVLIAPRSLAGYDFGGFARLLVAYGREHEGDLPSYTIDSLEP